MIRFTCYILLFLLILFNKAYSLTVSEVIERVVNNSPELRVIFEKKNQSIEDYKDQRSAYLPQIYTILNREYQKDDPLTAPGETSYTSINKLQVFVEQRIFDMEQITKIIKQAQVVQTQEFENQKLLESLIQMAIAAYYDVIQAEYMTSIYKEYLRQVRDIEQLTISMRKQGDSTLADVNLAQSRVADANSELISAQANLDKVKLRLAYLLNLVEKNQLTQSGSVLPTLTDKDFYDLADKVIVALPLTPETLINRVLSNNVDILTLRSSLCSMGYDLEIQKSRYLPVVNLITELRSEEERTNSSFDRYGKVSIEARYSIYEGGSRASGVRKYSSIIKEQEYQYDILVRDTSDKAFSALNILRSYEQQRISVLKEIETVEEVDRMYNMQFQFANRNLTDRLDNLERLTNARIKLVNVDYSILFSRLQILMLMGDFVEFFGFQNYLEVSNLKLC